MPELAAPSTEVLSAQRPLDGVARSGGNAAPRRTSQEQSIEPEFRIEALHSADGLSTYEADWNDLAAHAIERNPFYEPWMLLPALKYLNIKIDLRFYLVWQRNPHPNQPPALVGLFPLELRRTFKGLPVRLLRLFQHDYLYYCAPLVRSGVAPQVLHSLFEALPKLEPRLTGLELHHVDATGPFSQVLLDLTNDRRASTYVADAYNRALFRPAADYDAYIASAMTNHNRQEIRRQRRRLAELGRLEVRMLSAADDLDHWLSAFLSLESAGWKGHEQSALACSETSRTYFEAIARAAFERGQLMMVGLFLDDRPVALKCNYRSGDGSYAFKIAFDESLSKYSPGVQLELENVRLLHETSSIKWMDSCATRKHFMISRMWQDRRTIHHQLVSTGTWWNNVTIDVIAALSSLRRAYRRKPSQTPSSQSAE